MGVLLESEIEFYKIGLIGFRYDHNSSFKRGAAKAPEFIRKAFYSDSFNLWSENGTDLGHPKVFFDVGDITSVVSVK